MRSLILALLIFVSLSILFLGCSRVQGPRVIFETGVAGTSTGEGTLPEDSNTPDGAYPVGATVRVKAVAETNSVFTGWYGASHGGVLQTTENPYVVVLEDSLGLFARFDTDITRYDLSDWESIGTAGFGVKVPVVALPNHFRIWNAEEGSPEMDLLSLVYEPAIRRNPVTLEWEASLAESFTLAPDGSSVNVVLRDDLYWSDGEPLTAADFVFAADVYQSGEVMVARDLSVNGAPTAWLEISSLEYMVSASGSYGSILEIAAIPPLPEHVFRDAIDQDASGLGVLDVLYGLTIDSETIVGNGPFRPVTGPEATEDGELAVLLWKNCYFFEKDANGIPLPYLTAVMFIQGNSIQLFNADDADLCRVTGDTMGLISRSDAQVYNTGPGEMQILFINQNPDENGDGGVTEPALSWLTNTNFRKALAHIVNRSRIVTEAYGGYASAVYSPIHPDSPYYWPDVETTVPTYKPAAAETLLDDEGWIDSADADTIREDSLGNNISLTLIVPSGNTEAVSMCNIIAEEADAVGIDITVQPVSTPELSDRLYTSYDWQLACVSMDAVLDPALLDSVIPTYGANHLREPGKTSVPPGEWEDVLNFEWTTVMETADDFEAGTSSARYLALKEIQNIWATQVPWIYIAGENTYEAYQGNLANVGSSALDVVHPFEGHGWQAVSSRMFYE